ncbi:serine hydrolase domain-containing protein [Bacillus sp. CHD6a]|uniref:serine hydrolase domain-containing protein n=1 Tax=Bacillus sp. CHD6a TaxID=1643452 RepID=UPI0006CC2462|nr:serine hydrolase [Bacillus sp. CHD6a]KPB05899.1 penicillin-binding protein [Bacillus sp. CHD6a]
MKLKTVELETKLAEKVDETAFSGVIHVENRTEIIHASAHGFSNRAESILNTTKTRFGIASGCKLFTAIGICQLVESGALSFQTTLSSLLNEYFPHFHEEVTVHHLLTHSSGIPDYFDEDEMDDFEELWVKNPMYHMRQLEDFLPLFQNQQMKLNPGEKFHYNNAGYIVLGLIMEKVAGVPFTKYVEEHIFKPARMEDSGYFSLDCLPANTALGYIDKEDGSWKTNSYSIPIKGGADGGAYVTASDMANLWRALMNGKLVSKEMVDIMTTPCIQAGNDYYGYGIWIEKAEDTIVKYHVMGYDPGVSFASGYYPESETIVVIPSNKERGPHKLMYLIEDHI